MARHYICSILLYLLFGASSQPAFLSLAQDKSPMPPAEAQAKALALVKEVYGQEWEAAKTPKDRQALATKLLQKATETTDATDRYVLLDVAWKISAQAGDPELAFKAIEAMTTRYGVDAYRLKGAAVSQAAKVASSSAKSVVVPKLSLELIEEAVKRHDFVAAKYLGRIAVDAARKARESALAKEIVARNSEIEEIGQAFADIQDTLKTLKTNPVDPQANLAVGRYYCFFKGDWDRGLPMLAMGNDEKLKELAAKELKGVSAAEAQVALGDGWWDLASANERTVQKQLQGRAGYWYRKALPGLTGLVKDKLEKRVTDIADTIGSSDVTASDFSTGGKAATMEKPTAVRKPRRESQTGVPLVDTLEQFQKHWKKGDSRGNTYYDAATKSIIIDSPYKLGTVTAEGDWKEFHFEIATKATSFGRFDMIINDVTFKIGPAVVRFPQGTSVQVKYAPATKTAIVFVGGLAASQATVLDDKWTTKFRCDFSSDGGQNAKGLLRNLRLVRQEEKDAGAATRPTLVQDSKNEQQIPPQAVEFKEHKYQFVKAPNISWNEAKEACEKLGGHLVCIETDEELKIVNKVRQGVVAWVGGWRHDDGQWRWLNGQVIPSGQVQFQVYPLEKKYFYVSVFGNGAFECRPESSLAPEKVEKLAGYVCEWE